MDIESLQTTTTATTSRGADFESRPSGGSSSSEAPRGAAPGAAPRWIGPSCTRPTLSVLALGPERLTLPIARLLSEDGGVDDDESGSHHRRLPSIAVHRAPRLRDVARPPSSLQLDAVVAFVDDAAAAELDALVARLPVELRAGRCVVVAPPGPRTPVGCSVVGGGAPVIFEDAGDERTRARLARRLRAFLEEATAAGGAAAPFAGCAAVREGAA